MNLSQLTLKLTSQYNCTLSGNYVVMLLFSVCWEGVRDSVTRCHKGEEGGKPKRHVTFFPNVLNRFIFIFACFLEKGMGLGSAPVSPLHMGERPEGV